MTVAEFDGLVKTMFEKREEIEALEELSKDLNKQLQELQGKAVVALKERGESSYKTQYGTVSIMERWRVNLPQTDEDKKAMFGWFETQGTFWQYATINSNSLNSIYMKEWEAAKERGEGMTFKFPGLGDAKLHETLSMRKA